MATPANIGGSRVLLRKLREIMSTDEEAQQRLDRLVAMVASTMVADVCSIYLTRGAFHELFATQGLKPEAVHATRLKSGEGLIGLVAETAQPLNIADAQHHERFAYRPETGEEPFNALLGVPIVRSERVFGVLVVQNRVQRQVVDTFPSDRARSVSPRIRSAMAPPAQSACLECPSPVAGV
jgi:phosphotransferase system enzyme I (PtsP)